MTSAISAQPQTDADSNSVEKVRYESLWFSLAVTLGFFAIAGFGMLHHELWMDEMQAWLIARDSADLPALLANVREELHPLLWYLCLTVITRITHAPEAMQLFQLGIATTTAFLIAHFGPFPRWMRVLMVLGYFPLFEYGVLSRCYGLGLLLMIASLICHGRRKHYAWQILLLPLLASTSIFASIIAVALAVSMAFEYLLTAGFAAKQVRRCALIAGAFVLLGVALLAYLAITRAEFMTWVLNFNTTSSGAIRIPRFEEAVKAVVQTYLPVPDIRRLHFWNLSLVAQVLRGSELALSATAAVILGFWALIFRRRPVALCMYLAGSAALLLIFSMMRYWSVMRHQGHLFLVLMAALWLSHTTVRSRVAGLVMTASDRLSRFETPVLVVLLLTHAVSAGLCLWMDYLHPFSTIKAVAAYLRQQKLDRVPIIVYQGDSSALAGYLDCKLFFPRFADYGSYVQWNKHNGRAPMATGMTEVVRTFVLEHNGPCVIVVNLARRTKRDLKIDDLKIDRLGTYAGSIVARENAFVYLAAPAQTRPDSSEQHSTSSHQSAYQTKDAL